MTPDQESRLTGGGDSPDHYHSQDRTPTIDTLRQLQYLEIVTTITAALNMETDTDSKKRNTDYLRCDATGGIFTVTLPKAKASGRRITLSRVASANTVTIAAQGGETVSGTTTLTANFTPRTYKAVSATAWEEV